MIDTDKELEDLEFYLVLVEKDVPHSTLLTLQEHNSTRKYPQPKESPLLGWTCGILGAKGLKPLIKKLIGVKGVWSL